MKKKKTFINSRHTLERTDIGNLPNRREMLIEDLEPQKGMLNIRVNVVDSPVS